MAVSGMALGGNRTHQILALDSVGSHQTDRPGEIGQTPLDHRAGLRRVEAGTGPGTLRRPRLARIPSSRHTLRCRVRVPGDRAYPFFPLRPRGSTTATRREDSCPLPAPRLAACAPNGITHSPSPRSASRSPEPCSSNSPAAPFAARSVYNTVILGYTRSGGAFEVITFYYPVCAKDCF